MKQINTRNNTFTLPSNRENFNRYIAEIGKLKPLSREEEVELFKKIELDDEIAIEKICKHNLLFVVAVANQEHSKVRDTNISLEDLISEGTIGLQKAIKKFDYRRGFKFISYAVWWIRQQINLYSDLNKKNIRMSQSSIRVLNKFKKTENYLEQKLSRVPTTLETFELMLENEDIGNIYSVNRLVDLINISKGEKSLSTFLNDDETTDLSQMIKSDDISPEEELLNKERRQHLMNMLSDQPEHISKFLIDYYGIETGNPLTIKEVAELYDISISIARRRIDLYLRRIRSSNRDKSTYFFPTPDYEFISRTHNN